MSQSVKPSGKHRPDYVKLFWTLVFGNLLLLLLGVGQHDPVEQLPGDDES